MLGKMLGMLALVAVMMACFFSWLWQDIALRRRIGREAVAAAAAIGDETQQQFTDQQDRTGKKRVIAFPSNFTMTLERVHIISDSSNEEEDDTRSEQEESGGTSSEKADYTMGHQAEQLNTTRILVPAPGIERQKDNTMQEQQNESRIVPGECIICLNTYIPLDKIVWSSNASCPHVFHLQCMKKWSKKRDENVSCPCCRQKFLEDAVKCYEMEEPVACPTDTDFENRV